MKKKICFLLPALLLLSCERQGGTGELRISFVGDMSDPTRSELEIPDTSDFILNVSDSDGNVIYEGEYGKSPEAIEVDAGSYTVRAVSCSFERPAFDQPQFGDEQCVVVPDGGTVNVRLDCVQLNSGVRLRIGSGFLSAYPSASLLLKSDEGSLMYSYKEKRVAYFKPGKVSLVLSQGAEDKVLMTRHLEPQEILSIGVTVASADPDAPTECEGISFSVDTSRYWLNETYVLGGDDGKGDTQSEALTVSQAKASVGEEDVWVSGYVTGGDLTSTSAVFEGPFTSRTNILLGSRAAVDERDNCMSVQLSSGSVRDNLNLVDNPGLLGRKILVKGDIVDAYYGLTGVKNITEFKIL